VSRESEHNVRRLVVNVVAVVGQCRAVAACGGQQRCIRASVVLLLGLGVNNAAFARVWRCFRVWGRVGALTGQCHGGVEMSFPENEELLLEPDTGNRPCPAHLAH
jgi:hypothetical protein